MHSHALILGVLMGLAGFCQRPSRNSSVRHTQQYQRWGQHALDGRQLSYVEAIDRRGVHWQLSHLDEEG